MTVRRLAVEFGEGEGPWIGEEGRQVVDRVEDCDDVEEGGGEADGILGKDSFGDVDAWVGDLFGDMGNAVTGRRY